MIKYIIKNICTQLYKKKFKAFAEKNQLNGSMTQKGPQFKNSAEETPASRQKRVVGEDRELLSTC